MNEAALAAIEAANAATLVIASKVSNDGSFRSPVVTRQYRPGCERTGTPIPTLAGVCESVAARAYSFSPPPNLRLRNARAMAPSCKNQVTETRRVLRETKE
jgi:hypothetical protein